MRQFWKFVICAAILSFCAVYAEQSSSGELVQTTTTISPITTTTTTTTSNTNEAIEETTTPEPLPTLAAKLVRQRRQHTYTIVRHSGRQSKRGTKSRRRYKWPKYKYGPPNYNTGAPITYYKPTKQYLPELSDSPKYSPIDELDLTNHFNSANNYDFHPITKGQGYEDQTMDLDFYSHTSGNAYQQTPKVSQIQFSSYDTKKESPTYSYTSTKTEVSSKPLHTYKAPKKHGPATYSSSSSSSSGGGGAGGGGGSDADNAYTYNQPENNYDMHPMSSYDAPSSSHANKFYEFTNFEDTNSHSNIHIPATKYGVPDISIPLHYQPPPAKESDYQLPPKSSSVDSYVVYEKKIPNAGYNSVKTSNQHNFAEPPAKTKVEITYSPSYEIALPPHKHNQAPIENYHPAPGHFAEPPPPSTSYKIPKTSVHQPPPPPPTYRLPEAPAPPPYKHTPAPPAPPNYHVPETHAPPTFYQEPELEPESHEPPTSYENADSQEPSSYEIPETHAPTSFHQDHDLHEPSSFHNPETHAPTSLQVPHPPIQQPADAFEVPESQSPPFYSAPSAPSVESPEPNYSNTATHSEYPQLDYIKPSQELPINSNYMPPAYNYPKSSYEVPIYDPIPFEASSAEEHETFPPHNLNNQHIDVHKQSASSPIPTSNVPGTHTSIPNRHDDDDENENDDDREDDAAAAPTRTTKGLHPLKKRKRMRNSQPTATTKHILDTPELEDAYEANRHRQQKNQLAPSNDADVNESNRVEASPSNEPNYFLPTLSPDTINEQSYISPAWNPIRIRAVSTPTALPAATAGKAQTPSPPSTATIIRAKGQRQQAARTTTTTKTTYRQQSVAGFTPSHGVTQTRQTTPLHSEGEKVAAVTVDKSHSYSYYDGTSAPPRAKEPNLHRTRTGQQQQQRKRQRQQQLEQQKQHQQKQQPTRTRTVTTRQRAASTRDQTAPHRTTKSVFETTYFKSPHNDHLEQHLEAYVQNLPKNHKWF